MRRSKQTKKALNDSDEQFQATKPNWNHSQNTAQNHTQRKDGQTLFDFIKRRKRYAIKQEISKKKKSPVKKSYREEHSSDFQETERVIVNKTPNKNKGSMSKSPNLSSIKYEEEYMTPRQSVSPFKRVTFGDSAQPSSRCSKSILEALSPFKKRLDDTTVIKENTFLNNSLNSSFRQTSTKNLQNDKILAKISNLCDQLEACAGTARTYKNKSYSLVTETLSLLDEEGTTRPAHKKKIAQMKAMAKVVDQQGSEFVSILSSISLGQILRLVKQRFCSIQSTIQKQCDEELQQQISQTVDKYQKQIREKDSQLQKLKRQFEKLQAKLKNDKNRSMDAIQERERQHQKSQRQVKNKYKQWKDKQTKLLTQNQQLNSQIANIQIQVKQLQRQVKTLEHERNSLVKGFQMERKEVQSSKERYMIEQISKLKKKHQQDILQIQSFNKLKQSKYIQELNRVQTLLKDHQQRQKIYAKFEGLNTSEVQTLKNQVNRTKLENSALRQAALKLEQQSFNFWGALKDVKILSSRLGIFGKFSRIYDDIQFSDVVLR